MRSVMYRLSNVLYFVCVGRFSVRVGGVIFMKNRKLLVILLSVLLVCVGGCSESRKIYGDNVGDFKIDIFTHNGTDLECIASGHRLSCNWEKYNELKKTY